MTQKCKARITVILVIVVNVSLVPRRAIFRGSWRYRIPHGSHIPAVIRVIRGIPGTGGTTLTSAYSVPAGRRFVLNL